MKEQREIENCLQKSGDLVMNKVKVLLLTTHYPLSMASYFMRAFNRRDDIELRTMGPYTGTWIPWANGIRLPVKYAISPTYPGYLGQFSNNREFPWSMAASMLQGWQPDLIITIDAGIMFDRRPDSKCLVVHVATDPHYLEYDVARTRCDTFYNMQKCYMKGNDKYLPYAFDPTVHYPMSEVEKTSDCVLIGVTNPAYQERSDFIAELRLRGVSVINDVGYIFDEYREMNNQASIGLHSSTKDDMAARVFELPAMGLAPVINRVPDLVEFFEENNHYLGFTGVREGVEKVMFLKSSQEQLKQLAVRAHDNVWKIDSITGFPQHSYDSRVWRILNDGGFIG